MPTVSRQAPPRSAAVPATNGSILSTAVPTTSLREEWVKVCIYGRNRSGKTTTACMFPKPLLIVSCEPDANGGAYSVANVPGVSLIRVSSKKMPGDRVHGSEKVHTIASELVAQNPYRTVVLDTATSLQDIVLIELLGYAKMPEVLSKGIVPRELYPQRAEKLRETLRPLLDLANCHVVVLAQEKDHNPPEDFGGRSKLMHTMQQGSFMAPALGATNAQWLQDACGYVLQIYEDEVTQEVVIPQTGADGKPLPPAVQRVGTGRRQRHLRLLYHPNFAGGGRWQYNRDTPEFVTAPTPQELYAAMAKYIHSLGV